MVRAIFKNEEIKRGPKDVFVKSRFPALSVWALPFEEGPVEGVLDILGHHLVGGARLMQGLRMISARGAAAFRAEGRLVASLHRVRAVYAMPKVSGFDMDRTKVIAVHELGTGPGGLHGLNDLPVNRRVGNIGEFTLDLPLLSPEGVDLSGKMVGAAPIDRRRKTPLTWGVGKTRDREERAGGKAAVFGYGRHLFPHWSRRLR